MNLSTFNTLYLKSIFCSQFMKMSRSLHLSNQHRRICVQFWFLPSLPRILLSKPLPISPLWSPALHPSHCNWNSSQAKDRTSDTYPCLSFPRETVTGSGTGICRCRRRCMGRAILRRRRICLPYSIFTQDILSCIFPHWSINRSRDGCVIRLDDDDPGLRQTWSGRLCEEVASCIPNLANECTLQKCMTEIVLGASGNGATG